MLPISNPDFHHSRVTPPDSMSPASEVSQLRVAGAIVGSAVDSHNPQQSVQDAPTTPQLSQKTTPIHTTKPNKFTTLNSMNPTMKLPETVEGYIDLQTLGKIQEALCESQDLDDVSLAAWIKENYLFEPIGKTEDGRPIRSREGFQKLDKAYKRVRLLTNRAQDKWPFFDRSWKKMSATTVRQVAQGEMQSSPPQLMTLQPEFRLPAREPRPATDVFSIIDSMPLISSKLLYLLVSRRVSRRILFAVKTKATNDSQSLHPESTMDLSLMDTFPPRLRTRLYQIAQTQSVKVRSTIS